MKVKARRLYLAALGLVSVFALGTGSVSAAGLLFETATFPYHATGLAVGLSKLEGINGKKITSSALHVLARVLSKTLFDLHFLFLGVRGEAGALSPCGDTASTTSSEHVLIELLGHFGLADPGNRHAVLLEVHEGFVFFCHNPLNGLNEELKWRGSLIATITKPAAGVTSEELGVIFKQTSGKQEFTEFLLPTLMTNQILEISLGGGPFEQAGMETPEVVLKPLVKGTTFKLVLD